MKSKKANLKGFPFKSKALFTIVGGAVLINPAFAQDAQSGDELEEIVVTGLRGSLKAAMEIKRDAVGVVDAINAEDIGKFPDTNLAEALQRITGVSIDRRNGEGALVTARGFGPQYNLVTLNGRQMPGAEGFGSGDVITGGQGSGSRSFNFAQLAAEAISGVEVYKTGRADISSGGIGAVVNIKTARPFDNDGLVLNLGVKAVDDTSNKIGSDITPEVSGIFSYANPDKTWGIGLNASYQKRNAGSIQATVNNWNIQAWQPNMDKVGDVNGNNQLGPFAANANIENAPSVGQLYGIPNDIRYAFSDLTRERTNAQAVVQFAPADTMTLTLDYTFARNDITEDRSEQTVWMQRNGFTHVVFDTGEEVATPVLLDENTGSGKDFGYEQQHNDQRNQLNSLGFNMNWDVSDRFNIGLDVHDSKAKTTPNDGITGASQTAVSVAGKYPSECLRFAPNPSGGDPICVNSTNAWSQTFQFNNGLPIAGRALYADTDALVARSGGNPDVTFDAGHFGSQVLRTSVQEQTTEVKQVHLDNAIKFDEGRLQFGLETRDMDMKQRTSGGYLAMGDWGVADLGKYPDLFALMTPFSITGQFDDFNANGAPTGGFRGNADQIGLWAMKNGYTNWSEDAAPDGKLRYNPGYNNNNDVQEKTTAFYLQYALHADVGNMPANIVAGARYESTDVTSTSTVLPVKYLTWQDDNDFQVTRTGDPAESVTTTGTGHYTNVLPSLDFDIGLLDSLKARASYSKTIARANYGNLTNAVNPNGPGGSTLNGFQATGGAQNPALLPLESTNVDLSLEWYFSDTGYISAGYFTKDIVNFIGNANFDEAIVGLGGKNIKNQTGGPRAQAALAALQAAGAGTDDTALFTMMAMMEHPGGFTDKDGVFWAGGAGAYNATNAQHIAWATQYDLLPRDDDPDYIFRVGRPVNNKEATIHGWEFGGQYFLGETGFGILANYTMVDGSTQYENANNPNSSQFALIGLSDSANVVLMYEKFGISARLAYNWRDEFLSNGNFGSFNNPIYVEAYDQYDLSVGYNFNEHLSLSLEAINLTGEDVRWHGRSTKQVWRLEDQSPRYAIGARYKF
ncbi:MAG TPA: TonB-dependent receptor [Steroidobacteraceae bacterium]|nr:TonB-dependent receptor [Steroidobacteraceae bacterium]